MIVLSRWLFYSCSSHTMLLLSSPCRLLLSLTASPSPPSPQPAGRCTVVRHARLLARSRSRSLQAHGGSLALYNVPYSGPLYGRGVEAGEPATLVAPLGGRLVVFEGHLFHEVLPAHSHRWERHRLDVGCTDKHIHGQHMFTSTC